MKELNMSEVREKLADIIEEVKNMDRKLEIDAWIKKAREDLSTAKYNFDGEKYEAAAFFAQQSAEKSLKSVYLKLFKELIKTHDLVLLARKIDAPKEFLGKKVYVVVRK